MPLMVTGAADWRRRALPSPGSAAARGCSHRIVLVGSAIGVDLRRDEPSAPVRDLRSIDVRWRAGGLRGFSLSQADTPLPMYLPARARRFSSARSPDTSGGQPADGPARQSLAKRIARSGSSPRSTRSLRGCGRDRVLARASREPKRAPELSVVQKQATSDGRGFAGAASSLDTAAVGSRRIDSIWPAKRPSMRRFVPPTKPRSFALNARRGHKSGC